MNDWASSPGTPSLRELVAVLNPTRYDRHGLWRALLEHITPPEAFGHQASDETERVLHWLNQGAPAGRLTSRILYCELDMAGLGSRTSEFIAGAIEDFTRLHSLRPEVRVLVLFACLYRESGLGRFLDRLRAPRLPRHELHLPLGALTKLSQADVEHWLSRVEHPGLGGRCLDTLTLQHLRGKLEPLFPNDAARVRYRQARRAAISILNPAACTATSGDRP